MEKKERDYLAVGKIVNTHGIRGELRVIPMTSDISRFDYLLYTWIRVDGKLKEYRVSKVRYHKQFVLVKLQGVDSMTDAEALKGCELLVDRQNARPLEEDEYFICDLIGMKVYEEDRLLGELTEVLETGSNDVYVVTGEDKKEILVPALKQVVTLVDLKNKSMQVKLPEGLLDEV
ncbi:MAG TPA: ribosome maturation factor RimM [Thermoclostridium sp.]|nr:16S rRNA processing protein RimM [Clostridiaceae bacterium]HOQ75803.1 ribosome maturation factor RimM [Thermoclostridium sp.]HPU45418.1 ribosome maturation factor RimM [Thermoclostridium sp.]